MSNTNPNSQKGANLVEAHFTSLDADAQAAILAVLPNRAYNANWSITSEPLEVVPARDGYRFVITDLLIVSDADFAGLTGETFTLGSLSNTEVFDWDDYIGSLNGANRIAHIVQAGIDGDLSINGSPITLTNSSSSIYNAMVSIVGVWFAV